MKTDVMFSKASDEWSTPQALFDALNAEFGFAIDVAATNENTKCANYFGAGGMEECGLQADWLLALGRTSLCGVPRVAFWMNPPYSSVGAFMDKAAREAMHGATVVCLVPSRTDTKWWHRWVWDGVKHRPYPWAEVRFIQGRLKFGQSKNSAPFPSVVVIFRPPS